MLMMNRLLILLLLPSAVFALGLDSLQLEMASSEQQLRQLISNNGKVATDYTVQLQRIDFPDHQAKILAMPAGELLVSPAQLSLMPGQSDYLRFQYLGAADTQERYYRVTLTETEQTLALPNVGGQSASMDINTRVESILVVRPRQIKLDYLFNHGHFSNIGNSYIVIKIDENCGKTERITYYLAPGRQYILPELKEKSMVSVLLGDKLTTVLNLCSPRA